MHRIVRFMNGDKHFVGFISDVFKLLGKYQSVGYMLKWFTVSVKGRMGSDSQTTSVTVEYTDNEQELMHNGTKDCRLMLSTPTEYPTYGVSVGIHLLCHLYAENYYV